MVLPIIDSSDLATRDTRHSLQNKALGTVHEDRTDHTGQTSMGRHLRNMTEDQPYLSALLPALLSTDNRTNHIVTFNHIYNTV